ncbi:shikimate kinase [Lelliottia sp. F153]|nr:shikimate kinase [Lelliottia sp. WB101]PKA30273.1 shikimate kinase [Cedecea lapagei]PLY44238.1 shikimate kinase [Lelliottia sp. F159]PLY49442.1 shikimate kinase [Lelliottia sp. F154]PLY53786.1 shikimate kinase [Lelliottia sp. F153]RXJ19790.1 shikimate kinase [Lelliottia nimipressuralis]UQC72874.1 shikimate kinase [Lelliottia sp. AC1]
MFDVGHELAYKEYRFEFQLLLILPLVALSIWRGDLISCQTSRTTEIIFSLTLALSHMRFQFMSCYAECLRSGDYH